MTEFVRHTESDLLFNHSVRVYFWGALAGNRRWRECCTGLSTAARDSDSDVDTVWNAIALHTTPSISEFMRPEIALVQVAADIDVAGRGFDTFTAEQRDSVTAAFPREANFKHGNASTRG